MTTHVQHKEGAMATKARPRSQREANGVNLYISLADAKQLLALLETTDQYPDVVDVLRQALEAR